MIHYNGGSLKVSTPIGNQFCKSPPLKLLQTWRRVLSPDVIKLSGLNSISSGICEQNTHFNMYARTSKPQEGFTCKDSHAKCFKTTNSTVKLYRGAMYRGEVLRARFRPFLLCFHFYYEI